MGPKNSNLKPFKTGTSFKNQPSIYINTHKHFDFLKPKESTKHKTQSTITSIISHTIWKFEIMGCEAPKKLNEGFRFNENTLSRYSSAGACSSRVYYYRNATEGIPFQWEMQPGMAKDPPREEAIPPLSPPPAILSLGLPKPCINEDPTAHKPLYHKLRLVKVWIKRCKKTASRVRVSSDQRNHNKDERSECKSPCSSRSSSSSLYSSSLLSFSDGISREQSPAWDPPNNREAVISCSPWSLSHVFVRLGRKVDK